MISILSAILDTLKAGSLKNIVKKFEIGAFPAPTIDNMPICVLSPHNVIDDSLSTMSVDLFVYGYVQPNISVSLTPVRVLEATKTAVRELENVTFDSSAVMISRPELSLDVDTLATSNCHYTVSCTLRLGRI